MKTHWNLISQEAPWGPRDSAGAVVFQERMWLFGGWQLLKDGDFKRLSDVWHSADGLTWEQVTHQAAWPARNLAGCVVFNDRIWLLGGFDGVFSFADVWCSADGHYWDHVVAAAPWGGRGAFGCVVYGDKIWVIGGVNWESETAKGDVWCSSDGVQWALVTDSPGWVARAMFPVLVFDDRMWLVGGGIYHDRMINHNDVWCSTDGVEWQPFTENAAWQGRRFHEALVFADRMWFFGGIISERTNMNDVWYSVDGAQWQRSNRAAPWGVRHEPVCLAFGGKVWLLGGYSGSATGSTVYNDIWTMEVRG